MAELFGTLEWDPSYDYKAERDRQLGAPEVGTLRAALQEVLQGFAGPKNRDELVERLSSRITSPPPTSAMPAAAGVSRSARLMPCSSSFASVRSSLRRS